MNTEILPRFGYFNVLYKDIGICTSSNKRVLIRRSPAGHMMKKPFSRLKSSNGGKKFIIDHKVIPDFKCLGVFSKHCRVISLICYLGTTAVNKNTASRRSIS